VYAYAIVVFLQGSLGLCAVLGSNYVWFLDVLCQSRDWIQTDQLYVEWDIEPLSSHCVVWL